MKTHEKVTVAVVSTFVAALLTVGGLVELERREKAALAESCLAMRAQRVSVEASWWACGPDLLAELDGVTR